jgi:large subunit ribosomal protein L24
MIKKGDKVIVLTGKDKGAKGDILKVMGDRVVVSGVAKIKRHMKPKNRNEKGSIVEKESSIHISNVKLAK